MTWTPGPAWLFCPADRPDRYAKAFARADEVIIDLEDAVAPDAKSRARDALGTAELDLERTVVRVNAADSEHFPHDLELVRRVGVRRVMLPKAENGTDVDRLSDLEVIALIESARGARAVDSIAASAGVVALMWGPEDLVASLGGFSSRHPDGSLRDVPRTVRADTLVAAKARDLLALDTVFTDIGDTDGLAREAGDAVAMGFDAKVAIHPRQVAVVRDAFTPTREAVDWATRLLAAAEGQPGVFRFEGRMVDGPIFRYARRVLQRSGEGDRPHS